MITIDGVLLEIGHFPDGTLLTKYDAEAKRYTTSSTREIVWNFQSNEEMVALFYIVRHLQSHGYHNIRLIMPYIPNARQDRVKSDEDVFTLKYFAEFINSLHFTEVVVIDPHSSVATALIDNITAITPEYYIEIAISRIQRDTGNTPTLMFYPDEGAMKRYSSCSKLPYVFGIKDRDWMTGQINGLSVTGATDLINGSTVLIVDDICSRGGTFYFGAKKLKELGADKVYLYVTHCENTIIDGSILQCGLIEKVFTTDSLFTAQHEMIDVISFLEEGTHE